VGGAILNCNLATIADFGYSCSDVIDGDHEFLELDSGLVVHEVYWTENRDYPGTEFDGYVLVSSADFMCCTNEIVTMEFEIASGLSESDLELAAQLMTQMKNSFSFSTTPNFIQTTELYSYEPTHVQDYPDNTKPPQYYLDRYNNEPNYQEWFDSQFPDRTIYDVVGLPNPVQIEPEPKVQKIPDWIKNTFAWYVQGQISEDEVLSAIKFLVNQGIIVLDD
jgi:hypothetical protein